MKNHIKILDSTFHTEALAEETFTGVSIQMFLSLMWKLSRISAGSLLNKDKRIESPLRQSYHHPHILLKPLSRLPTLCNIFSSFPHSQKHHIFSSILKFCHSFFAFWPYSSGFPGVRCAAFFPSAAVVVDLPNHCICSPSRLLQTLHVLILSLCPIKSNRPSWQVGHLKTASGRMPVSFPKPVLMPFHLLFF